MVDIIYGWFQEWNSLLIGWKVVSIIVAYYIIKWNIQSFMFGVRSALQVEDVIYREKRTKNGCWAPEIRVWKTLGEVISERVVKHKDTY